MRVLLDENLPRALAAELRGHQVTTVQMAGWSGTGNGELLRRARDHFDADAAEPGPHLRVRLPRGNYSMAVILEDARRRDLAAEGR